MKSVPTPCTKIGCLPGDENRAEAERANAECARLAALVTQIQQLSSAPDSFRLLPVLTELRKVLAAQIGPPIQQIIDLGGLPPLVALLNAPSSALQLEAAWAITNMASGSSMQALAIVEAGAPEALFAALQSPSVPERADLCAQLLWALGNIALDQDPCLRDRLLEAEVVGHVGQLFAQIPGFSWDPYGRTEVLRKLTWLMSCLCGGQPAPKLEEVDCAFDYFVQVVTGTEDLEMLTEALWGLYSLLEGATDEEGDARAKRMLSAGFGDEGLPPAASTHPLVAQLVRSLGCSGQRASPTVAPALKILGTLVSASSKDFVDIVLSAGVLKALKNMLVESHCPTPIRKDVAWVISNIAGGDAKQAQKLLDEPGAFDALRTSLERAPSCDIRRECAWALANLAKQGSPVLLDMDCREVFRLVSVALAVAADPTLQRALLDAAEIIFRHSSEQSSLKSVNDNPILACAETFGFLDMLEELQHVESEEVHRKAARILEKFFGTDRTNWPPKDKAPTTPSAGQRPMTFKSAGTPSSICEGSPARPGYRFGA
jgi:hypothetical protein